MLDPEGNEQSESEAGKNQKDEQSEHDVVSLFKKKVVCYSVGERSQLHRDI